MKSGAMMLSLMVALLIGAPAPAQEGDPLARDILRLQDGWAVANYRTPKQQQNDAFKRLAMKGGPSR